MMVKAVLLIYEKCSAFLSKETLFVFENCNAPSVWKIQISKMKNPNPPIIRVYWHSQTTVCFQDFSYGFTYFILNLKCSRTPYYAAPAAAKSLQLCPTLCDPVDGSPPGSAIPGILQARTLEWVAISFSSAWNWKVKVKSLSCVRLLATPWTAAHQTLPPLGFSRQEHWGGLPLPSLTPYYSLQYIFIHEWEITNSFPYLSVLIFSIVFNGSQNFVMGVYSTIY